VERERRRSLLHRPENEVKERGGGEKADGSGKTEVSGVVKTEERNEKVVNEV